MKWGCLLQHPLKRGSLNTCSSTPCTSLAIAQLMKMGINGSKPTQTIASQDKDVGACTRTSNEPILRDSDASGSAEA